MEGNVGAANMLVGGNLFAGGVDVEVGRDENGDEPKREFVIAD